MRAFLVVMDSVGIGGAPDAEQYFNGALPDTGANTLGHIAQACAAGRAEIGRSGALNVPVLASLGLWNALEMASGIKFDGPDPIGRYGAATAVSRGKDTPSGHWELAGLPVPWDWHYFPNEPQSFSDEMLRLVTQLSGTKGTLANCHASGTDVIQQFGDEHIRSGQPICYTSVDSVFQIAAHEDHFGLQRLLDLCESLAPYLHKMHVGRVIARPFLGANGDFHRTTNRKDYAIAPPSPVLTNWINNAGQNVDAIGKIGDIFSMSGIDHVVKGSDADLIEHLFASVRTATEGSLTFANFVEFDSLYGHRRDVSGYARALEWFDDQLGKLMAEMQAGDLLILTADHGNDPTWVGTDHTRECVPVLIAGAGAGPLPPMKFSDVAATVAAHLGVRSQGPGRAFLP
ncbi:MAG: phosphopentomutase [Pseudoprimorskyibacter sp.]|nr:phosphopentomutase [Pseudoprimorskyibacter sp.]